ncbi:pseudouridylate synthase PUS7L isoform X2 [Scleropages formosus]|uniref:Pseudouridylate synthase PUS7L n=1 Tax=Scleropages formosus TaxID=113540 RepID=A0A8C9R9X7_SCLFO|nr:pseudouridylate synthase 7 homolog-like protein isoform X1 [Scleropages formosus]XP_018602568.2 pseudouridylate synthase 7 homolog-like protein isoform X2 [Scleropages formosus]XP_018602569.2 pseudouridylate synthase 7 homolog-like protein isoform X2 [Scleropages formosus]
MEEGARADGSSMLCYISAHEGFYGTIKNCTSDFVVTEIDVNGELVNSEDYLGKRSYPPPESSARLCCRGPKTEDRSGDVAARNCVAERTSGARVDGRDSDPTLVCEEPLDLELVLGHSVNEELEEFVSKSGAGEELSLGTFPDKRRRASLHRAVRHHYPHLMTRTNKSEILVKEDPNYKELSCLVSQEESENFFRFLDAKVPGSVFTFKQDDSKEHRKAVHHFLSKCFGKLVETKSFSSSNGDGSQGTAITVRFREKSTQTRKRTAADREDEGVRYAAFTLRKENLETLEAISYMATWLGVLPSDFTYAGIKDKRATTYQSMVVKKVSPQRLEEMSATFEKKGILLSHIRPVPEPLRLGALLGNHFDLVVRDVRVHHGDGRSTLQQIVLEALDNVKANGFVNYYGPQRFGTGQSVRADLVGLALLKHEMDVAVRLFFTPEEGDDPQNVAKRHFLNTGNAKESLTLMPEHKARERLLLRALHRYGSGPDGCTRAWLSLPHSTRVFYVHAYCSRLWNEGTTYRLQQFGHRVVQGDLVLDSRAPGERGNESPPQIHVVTAAEENDDVFSLRQVVLPMPGNTVKYPENAVGAWYRERLASDGLRDCRFRVTPLKLNVPGCYRPVLAVPRNVTQELRDLEDDPAAPSLALSFDLDSSCYATVCLREIMKCVA